MYVGADHYEEGTTEALQLMGDERKAARSNSNCFDGGEW